VRPFMWIRSKMRRVPGYFRRFYGGVIRGLY